jgi:WD40 repeat protein
MEAFLMKISYLLALAMPLLAGESMALAGQAPMPTLIAAPKVAVFTADANFVFVGYSDLRPKVWRGQIPLLRLWDVKTGKQVRSFFGHRCCMVWHVSLSTDGKLALSTGADLTVRLWNTKTGKETRSWDKFGELQT